MEIKKLICVECPMGCNVEVTLDGESIVDITGFTCVRGKNYASSEVVNPLRVITTTIKTLDGKVVPVKTDMPVPKKDMAKIIEQIKAVKVDGTIKVGQILKENICKGANLIATKNCD